jgi:hypothetical protein
LMECWLPKLATANDDTETSFDLDLKKTP